MKKPLLLFCILLLNACAVMAQIGETEPNDLITSANAITLNTNVSGGVCTYGQTDGTYDYFRFVTPVDGYINLRTIVSTAYPTTPGTLGFTLYSKTGLPYYSFSAPVGFNGASTVDSFRWGCRAADTFYMQVYYGFAGPQHVCLSYTFNCSVTPATFANDAEPDNYPMHPLPLAYNTYTEGHLSFGSQPISSGVDDDDYYTIVTPTDGVVRVITQTEAQGLGNGDMVVSLTNKAHAYLNDQNAHAGNFQTPHTDTLYWPCITKDMMHIRVGTDNFYSCGYAYRLKYDVIAPVFGNDAEPNNALASAQVVNPNGNIDGHLYFYNQGDDDYYKFYKPDTGFLTVYTQAENWDSLIGGPVYVLKLLNRNGNEIKNILPIIGSHSHPIHDSMVVASLPADTFYIQVAHAVFNSPCMSYRLSLRSNTITGPTGVHNVTATQFALYPNPSKGTFIIKTNTTAALVVKVYDMYGKMVYAQSFKSGAGIEVRLPDAAPGIYFVEMSYGGNRSTQKMIIE